MRTIIEIPKTGWELHQLMGDDPSLKWFLDSYKEIQRTGIASKSLQKEGKRWLLKHAVNMVDPHSCLLYPGYGLSPFVLRNMAKKRIEVIFEVFKKHKIIDEGLTLEKLYQQARDMMASLKRSADKRCPF